MDVQQQPIQSPRRALAIDLNAKEIARRKAQDAGTPIDRLPGELLQEIFLLSLLPYRGCDIKDTIYIPSSPSEPQNDRPKHANISLSHVCSHWYRLAVAHRPLWNAIHAYDYRAFQDIVPLIANRAGTAPLLNDYWDRTNTPSSLPNLETLAIFNRSVDAHPLIASDETEPRIQVPNLRRLLFNSWKPEHLYSFSGLREFALCGKWLGSKPPDRFLEVLRASPALETLTLADLVVDSTALASSKPISMPNLRRIILWDCDIPSVYALVPALSFPFSTVLSVKSTLSENGRYRGINDRPPPIPDRFGDISVVTISSMPPGGDCSARVAFDITGTRDGRRVLSFCAVKGWRIFEKAISHSLNVSHVTDFFFDSTRLQSHTEWLLYMVQMPSVTKLTLRVGETNLDDVYVIDDLLRQLYENEQMLPHLRVLHLDIQYRTHARINSEHKLWGDQTIAAENVPAAVEAEQPRVSLLNLYSLVVWRARSATSRMEHVCIRDALLQPDVLPQSLIDDIRQYVELNILSSAPPFGPFEKSCWTTPPPAPTLEPWIEEWYS